jgi:hypothetical protein
MLNTIVNPVGIDAAIYNLQKAMYPKLKKAWGIVNDVDYDSYGRIYRNKKDNQYIAEVYTGGASGEYKEVYWDDKRSAISWFGTGSSINFDINNKVSVHLVFFVNLKKLKPSFLHRADEEVRADVQKLFGRGWQGFTFEGVDLWLENVLREYPGSRRDNRLSAVDMQPIHCFRLNLSLMYNSNICVI